MAISNFTILKYTPMDAGFSSPRRTDYEPNMPLRSLHTENQVYAMLDDNN